MANTINFQNFMKTPIAHRGLHDDVVEENSMSAFRLAIENGYGIETDVHLMKDGTVAVFHDPTLKRVCGVNIKPEKLTAETLKNYPMTVGGEIIPTLPELLKLVDGKVPLLIELKSLKGVVDNRLARAVLRDLKDYAKKEMIALQSFDPFAVRYLVKHNKDFPCGQLASMGDPAKHSKPNIVLRFMGKLLCTKISHPEFISYDILNTPNEYIQKFLDDGMPVLSWTVNTDEKLALARKHTGNVIFENIRP